MPYKARFCDICGRDLIPTHPRQTHHVGECAKEAHNRKMKKYLKKVRARKK